MMIWRVVFDSDLSEYDLVQIIDAVGFIFFLSNFIFSDLVSLLKVSVIDFHGNTLRWGFMLFLLHFIDINIMISSSSNIMFLILMAQMALSSIATK